jgi:hypothetical protein
MWTRFEGEALIPWGQSALRRDQIRVKLLSPPLLVTSEFIDAGVSIIPDIEIGSHALPVSLVVATGYAAPRNPAPSFARSRLPRR